VDGQEVEEREAVGTVAEAEVGDLPEAATPAAVQKVERAE